MPRPEGISANPVDLNSTEKQLHGASQDPYFSVDVVENLVYDPTTSTLNRMVQPLSANQFISANIVSGSITGTFSLSADASGNRVSTFSQDAGLMRVSAVGGSTVSLSADASGNRVSAVQSDASNLHVSAKQGTYPWSISGNVSAFINQGTVSALSPDAALFRVSALGVTVTPVPLSADSSSVSAVQGDAGKLLVSAAQKGTWSISALLTESTSFIGNISAKNTDAANFHVSGKSDSAGQLRISAFSDNAALLRVSAIGGTSAPLSADGSSVSAIQEGANRLRVSAFVDSGNISAKSSDANQLHVSSVQGDAALLRVSAIGGTAGDNTLVDGTDQTVSAKLIQVSASVSSNMNTLLTRITSYDAANAHVSSYQGGSWTLSAFINEGSISAKNTDASSLHVSGKSDSAGQLRVSAFSNDAALLLTSAKTDSASQFRTSAFIDSGSISAKSGDANQLHTSAVQGDAALLHVSALGITIAASQSISALLKEGTSFIGQVSARQSGDWIVDSGSVSAKQGVYPWSVSGNVSAAINEGTNFLGNVSATIKNYPLVVSGTVSTVINQGTVSAYSPDASLFRVSTDIAILATDNGVSKFFLSAASAGLASVKSTAGRIYGYSVGNNLNASPLYVQFFDHTASAVTLGTTAPDWQIHIPPSGAANMMMDSGIPFVSALYVAATSANVGGSSPSTNGQITLFYK